MKPNKEETEKLFELYAKGNSPMQCTIKFLKEKDKMTDAKYDGICEKCLELIADFENRNSTSPKYILINRNTFVRLCAYLNKFDKLHQEKFLPSRDIYFYGVNLRLADIEDDEVIVGG